MKKILEAWVEQKLQFDSQLECELYLRNLKVSYMILNRTLEPDGKYTIGIRKQYNNTPLPKEGDHSGRRNAPDQTSNLQVSGKDAEHGYQLFEKLLKEKGVKTADVAKATNIHPSTFTDWKKGKSKPKADKLEKIANYFHGVSVTDFIESEEQSEKV